VKLKTKKMEDKKLKESHIKAIEELKKDPNNIFYQNLVEQYTNLLNVHDSVNKLKTKINKK